MGNINITKILFGFFEVIVGFTQQAAQLLFQEIDIFGNKIQLFYVFGGGVIIIMLVWWLVKKFI